MADAKIVLTPRATAQPPTPGSTVKARTVATMTKPSATVKAGSRLSFEWKATGEDVPEWARSVRIKGFTTRSITYQLQRKDLVSDPAVLRHLDDRSFCAVTLRDHSEVHDALAAGVETIHTVEIAYVLRMRSGDGGTWDLDPEVDLIIPCE